MKKTLVVLIAIFVLSTTMVFALISGDPVVKGQLPFLLTNAGQGPGGKMARLLIWQSKAIQETDFDYNAEPLTQLMHFELTKRGRRKWIEESLAEELRANWKK